MPSTTSSPFRVASGRRRVQRLRVLLERHRKDRRAGYRQRVSRATTIGVVLAVASGFISGCSTQGISQERLESEIRERIAADGPSEVSCEHGLDDEVGAATRCEITQDGYVLSARIEITSIRDGVANFGVDVDPNPVSVD